MFLRLDTVGIPNKIKDKELIPWLYIISTILKLISVTNYI